MQAQTHTTSFTAAALGGFGLASAMGIGRFAFTPMLPLMQHAYAMPLQQGSWLASANYVGYLIGALLCFALDLRPGSAARFGLCVVALTTFAMGMTDWFAAWMLLRTLAGVASAFALVGMASWALTALVRERRAHWAGWIFFGIGGGIVLAGLIGLVAGATNAQPAHTWLLFGAIATAIFALAWKPLADDDATPVKAAATTRATGRIDATAWTLIGCYGVYGFGYILPATFLPALGRQLLPDPLVFGWAWPAFGAAAALSTLIAAKFKRVPPRRLVAFGTLLTAAGVAAPAISPGLASILVSALFVGGSFVVVTMAAFQDARLIAGSNAPRVVAAMTAAFALGQLIGPLTVPAGAIDKALTVPSLAASVGLIAAALVLLKSPARRLVPAAD
ncbi:MAG TPA: YbfB/YjiJ family MFS transporter [Casimicrobiaceae bacterium]|nr:YbfB/YjiJ family MFS transporter [Casimicrobiaceae bacterium]